MDVWPRRTKPIVILFLVCLLLAACTTVAPLVQQARDEPCADASAEVPSPGGRDLLALSGGGYRAALFHVGAVWRLNDAGILARIGRVSSVSGGSITAGVLAANWHHLAFKNGVAQCFRERVAEPLIRFTSQSIDTSSVVVGMLPFVTAADLVERQYRGMFGDLTLADLPQNPDFIFNATNLQTGAIWRFGRRYMGDRSVGIICRPSIRVARAVAASSGFPPVLSPVKLDSQGKAWTAPFDGLCNEVSPTTFSEMTEPARRVAPEEVEKFRNPVILVDGGVADNLGLETLWGHQGRTFASDGGAGFALDADPPLNWLSQIRRVVNLIHDQPSRLRTEILRQAVSDKGNGGAFWTIDGAVEAHDLASIPTRLSALDSCTKQRLINWGYVAADKALRSARIDAPHMAELTDASLPFPHVGFMRALGQQLCDSGRSRQ